MFVTFIESDLNPRGLDQLDGATVSIDVPLSRDTYRVTGCTSRGEERTWDAHVDELVGFEIPEELR
jgi:hypothetical protein